MGNDCFEKFSLAWTETKEPKLKDSIYIVKCDHFSKGKKNIVISQKINIFYEFHKNIDFKKDEIT